MAAVTPFAEPDISSKAIEGTYSNLFHAHGVAVLDPGLHAGTARTRRSGTVHEDSRDGTLVERKVREVDLEDIRFLAFQL